MSQHDVIATLLDMIEYGEQALAFVAGRSRGDLDSDTQLRFAVIRALEIFGEAAGRIPSDFRAAHPEIPWRTIVATRNRLIHAYERVDNDIVWFAVVNELPGFVSLLHDAVEEA